MLLVGVAVLGCGGGGGGSAPAPAPTAVSFTQQPAGAEVQVGLPASFTAIVTGTNPMAFQWRKDGVAIPGATAATYAIPAVQPPDAGDYTVAVTNPAGTVVSNPANLYVKVVAKPTVSSFTATPASVAPGGAATLAWAQSGAATLSIDPGVGAVSGTTGSVQVHPSATTTYTFTATNIDGPTTATATVTVVPPPVISDFHASTATLVAGHSATLSWTVSGADSVRVDPGIGPTTASSAPVSPSATTTYTLTATNALGVSRQATATVTVEPFAITASPQPATVSEGYDLELSVAVDGTATAYQWRKGGADIPGATAAAYRVHGAEASDAGSYDVVVSNGSFTRTSAAAAVSVSAWDGTLAEWPNAVSYANSDPWLGKFHDRITKLRPKFLVINFANGIGAGGNDNIDDGPITTAQVRQKAQDFINGLTAASMYQPSLRTSHPFVEPEIYQVVDLQDGTTHANSAWFPRGYVDAGGYPLVGYDKLFNDTYTGRFGITAGGPVLSLTEALGKGLFHEIIMVANQVDGRDPNPPDQVTRDILEVAFVSQAYGADLKPIPGALVKNGVVHERQVLSTVDPQPQDDNSMPWPGRSLRIYFLNASRGSGCLLHSLAHEFEFRYNESSVYAPGQPYDGQSPNPYMQPLFRKYADFDMKAKYGASFDSLYAGGDHYSYTDCGPDHCDTLVVGAPGPVGTVPNYRPVAGNCHNPPGARFGYDYDPVDTVLSSVETWRQPGETAVPFNKSKWDYVTGDATLDGDCGGKFLVYWYQNMPGYQNPALDLDGKPMKNWWVFMYY